MWQKIFIINFQKILDIDNKYDNIYFKEDIIKESEKLPNKIKKSIEKGKIIEKEWNDNNLSSLINDCIIIENNINDINKINDNIIKSDTNIKSKIEYNVEEKEINNLIDSIQNLGKITCVCNSCEAEKKPKKNPIYNISNHLSSVFCLCV